MHKIESGVHIAHLDVWTGLGMLVLPLPTDDVIAPQMDCVRLSDGAFGVAHDSVNAADLRSMIRQLASRGWEIATDEWGDTIVEGVRVDGRAVVSRYAADPIHDDLHAAAVASGELLEVVGLC